MSYRAKERHVLERAVQSIAKQARDGHDLIDALRAFGLRDADAPMVAAKELRLELLRVKGDLERELSGWLLHCRRCNGRVHWVSGVAAESGHWAHAEPAPTDHHPVLA